MTNLNRSQRDRKFTLNDTPDYTTFIFFNIMLSLSDVSRDMIHEPFSVFIHMQLLINNQFIISTPLHTNCFSKAPCISQNSSCN